MHLVFIGGPYRRTREQRIDAPGGTIGSDHGATLSMPADGSVSSLHAQLSFVDNGWYLRDLGSANGTHLLVEDAGQPLELFEKHVK